MPNPLAIDAHAHICTEETMKLLEKETPKVAPKLKEYEKDVFEWTVAGVPYRPLPLGGFDIEQRLKDMKASDVDMQVLSNTPQTFLYNQDAGLTTAACDHAERPDRQARPRLSAKASTASRRCRCRRRRPPPTNSIAPSPSSGSRACRSAPTSRARISTSRSSSRSGQVANQH